ncbi:hypothetical protein ES703_98191 [subsurface metagenome]
MKKLIQSAGGKKKRNERNNPVCLNPDFLQEFPFCSFRRIFPAIRHSSRYFPEITVPVFSRCRIPELLDENDPVITFTYRYNPDRVTAPDHISVLFCPHCSVKLLPGYPGLFNFEKFMKYYLGMAGVKFHFLFSVQFVSEALYCRKFFLKPPESLFYRLFFPAVQVGMIRIKEIPPLYLLPYFFCIKKSFFYILQHMLI